MGSGLTPVGAALAFPRRAASVPPSPGSQRVPGAEAPHKAAFWPRAGTRPWGFYGSSSAAAAGCHQER